MAAEYAPAEPNRWVNISLADESIEQVEQTIKEIVAKYESTFGAQVDADSINNGLFK